MIALCISACTAEGAESRSDAGSPSALGIEGGHAPPSAATPDAEGRGATNADAADESESSQRVDAEPADDASSRPDSTAPDAIVEAGGLPGPSCMPPCVWDVVRGCGPPTSCTTEPPTGPPGSIEDERLVCGDDGRYLLVGDFTGPGAERTNTIWIDGELCFSFRIGAAGTGVFIPVFSWIDRTGDTIASGSGTRATCADGSGSFDVDNTAPECASWFFGPDCPEGTCPEPVMPEP